MQIENRSGHAGPGGQQGWSEVFGEWSGSNGQQFFGCCGIGPILTEMRLEQLLEDLRFVWQHGTRERSMKRVVEALHIRPFVTQDQVKGFMDEMRAAGVDWHLIQYGGAVHGFTNPNAGSDNSKGMAYNPKADKRSFQAMADFYQDIFAAASPVGAANGAKTSK